MPNGIIIIDKPQGWTSMDVCAKVRGILHERRVGHAGTLDPMATGVLPVFVGRATRAVEFVSEGSKEYFAGLRLGLVTDTQDVTGAALEEYPVSVTRDDVERALDAFQGELLQMPPMYSAIKKDGKKLYELARKGREVERSPRPVIIYELELLEGTQGAQGTQGDGSSVFLLEHGRTVPLCSLCSRPFRDTKEPSPCAPCADYLLRVVCSKGTYVRTLCHDIGRALGCGGVMSALRRSRAAGYRLEESVTLEALQAAEDPAALLRPVDSCFLQYPALTIDGRALFQARNGSVFPCAAPDGVYRFYGPDGMFLLLGRCEQESVTTIKSFFEV